MRRHIVGLCAYLLMKWLTDYRKCTLSYIECKLRGVPKEQGYLYQLLEQVMSINQRDDRYLYYGAVTVVLLISLYKP
jgi:hypothetical protein